ncbi:hypothetical protein J4461_02550 [Candidatus Pacearchaeota archaeon]|nr:hypothetical protein [Candidatus Pacearchaeota archaeon]
MRKLFLLLFISISFLFNFASAYGPYGGFGGMWSPQELLYNEWTRFALAFIVFFVIIFFASEKAFHNEKRVSIILSVALSLIISYALLIQGYLEFYSNSTILDWIIAIAFLLIIGIVIKFLAGRESKFGIIMGLFAVWGIITFLVYNDMIPLYSLPASLEFLINVIASTAGFIAVVLIAILISLKKKDHKLKLQLVE